MKNIKTKLSNSSTAPLRPSCNIKRLRDFPNLWAFTRALYQYPGVRDTVNMAETKKHYYASHASLNPTGIVPKGPELDLEEPTIRTQK